MELVEVVAPEDFDAEALEAQQRFVALEFPARFGSKVMKHLTSSFQPLPELGFAHLKRLKKLAESPKTLVALVCPLNSNASDVAEPSEELKHLETMFDARLTTAEALKLAPRSRELFEKHTKHWPLIFHASVEEAAALPPIDDDEKEKMLKHLKVAVGVGGRTKDEKKQTLSCAWGCVVVDPEADEIVATSEVGEEMKQNYKFEALYHPVMVAVDAVAERDRRRETEVEEKAAKKQKTAEGEDAASAERQESKETESYLCTGYDVYLDREPCGMCAMALVHSRARRVVFDRANPEDGVLLSSFKLHTIKSLNHHYRVFQLPISQDEVC